MLYLLWAGGERAPEEEEVGHIESAVAEKVIEDASTKFFVGTQVHVHVHVHV